MPLVRKPATPTALGTETPDRILAELKHEDGDVRWSAARAAGSVPGTVEALSQALMEEQNPKVREAILSSLARIASPQAIEAVLPLIGSDDAQLRGGALDALRAAKGAVWPYIPKLLANPDPDVRLLACELLRTAVEPEAVSLLCGLLDQELEINVCASAIEVLAEIGTAQALPSLQRCQHRFAGNPFLEFSIKVTIQRLGANTDPVRG